MAAMQVEHCFHCAHHTMESDRDRSMRTVLLANEIRKRKRQSLEAAVPVAAAMLAHHAQQQLPQPVDAKRRRIVVAEVQQPQQVAAEPRVREEKERAKRSERRVRITMKRSSPAATAAIVGTAAAPIVVVDDDDEVIESGHIKAAVSEVLAQHQAAEQQQLKQNITAASGQQSSELHVYDLYFSKESLGAIVNLVSEWIRLYDQTAYATFTKEEREKWIISLVQMIVQILNWRLNNFFSSYSQCFKIESFPNLFSKNFKADTSRVGVDKLAKKWQKRNYELLLATLMYADRYVRARGIKDVSLFHLLAISSLCTIKHWLEERNRHANRLFADVLGLTVQQVNALERTFLGGLNYSLSLAPEDFPHFLLAQIQRSAAKRA